MKKRIVIIAVAGILISSLAYAQIAAGVMFLRKRVHKLTQPGQDATDVVVQELTKELSLTAEQQIKVKSIIIETKTELENALMRGGQAIEDILTDEQKVKFEETRQKIKEQLKSGELGK
jgi:hypothetical protein